MSCNRDGKVSQKAANSLGAGDTEVLQMDARQNGLGTWTQVPPVSGAEIPEASNIIRAIDKADRADERRPFVAAADSSDYIPCNSPEEAVQLAQKRGEAAAYVYDPNALPANNPRSPIAIFDRNNVLRMTRGDWTGRVNQFIGEAADEH